jgi:hypothetical protein
MSARDRVSAAGALRVAREMDFRDDQLRVFSGPYPHDSMIGIGVDETNWYALEVTLYDIDDPDQPPALLAHQEVDCSPGDECIYVAGERTCRSIDGGPEFCEGSFASCLRQPTTLASCELVDPESVACIPSAGARLACVSRMHAWCSISMHCHDVPAARYCFV